MFRGRPAPTPTPPSEDPGTSAPGDVEQSRGEEVLRRRLDVENRGGGTGSRTDQKDDHRVGGKGGSENHGNTRVGGNGGIHDRGDHTQAGGNGDSANHQGDTPVDRNRKRGSLGRLHVRDDRTETRPDRRKRRRSPLSDARQDSSQWDEKTCVLRDERLTDGKSRVTAW